MLSPKVALTLEAMSLKDVRSETSHGYPSVLSDEVLSSDLRALTADVRCVVSRSRSARCMPC